MMSPLSLRIQIMSDLPLFPNMLTVSFSHNMIVNVYYVMLWALGPTALLV